MNYITRHLKSNISFKSCRFSTAIILGCSKLSRFTLSIIMFYSVKITCERNNSELFLLNVFHDRYYYCCYIFCFFLLLYFEPSFCRVFINTNLLCSESLYRSFFFTVFMLLLLKC